MEFFRDEIYYCDEKLDMLGGLLKKIKLICEIFTNFLFFSFSQQLHRFPLQHARELRLLLDRGQVSIVRLQLARSMSAISKWQHQQSDRAQREAQLHV